MTQTGMVYLVGGGPGDPGLLSLKGQWCLQQADLILYDGLVNPLLLRHSAAHAVRTNRTGLAGTRVLQQERINEQLVAAAKAGQTVVRLKGGDPYIFGRGSEEAQALRDAGIPFEVVPGITAATAASVYAGISLTHRDQASAVAFITGHEDPTKPESVLDYDTLAKFTGTLVFYMGLARLPLIVESLINAGKDPATPACVISRATTPLQRTVSSTLQELPGVTAEAQLHAPSLIIVGECVQQRERLSWFERLPLFGKRIGITRPIDQSGPAAHRALQLGAQPILLPTIEIHPPVDWSEVDAALDRLTAFDWLIFTSTNGVQNFFGRLWETEHDLRSVSHLKFACIGSSTAESLAAYHLRADMVPDSFRAEALAEALKPLVSGSRVLWAGANRGRDILPEELTTAGATVEKLIVYRNEDASGFPETEQELLEAGEVDWVGLSSPSIARQFATLLTDPARQHLGTRLKLASISPVTSAAAKEIGLSIAAEATTYTWEGIFEAITQAERATLCRTFGEGQ